MESHSHSIYITTLPGNMYALEYSDYCDLAKKIEEIDPNFHRSFQRLIREDGSEVFPQGLGRQPVMKDGEHVRLLMVNTVWMTATTRMNQYVFHFGHLESECGMYEYVHYPGEFYSGGFDHRTRTWDWNKFRQIMQEDVDHTGWPEWQKTAVVDGLLEKTRQLL